MITRTIQFTEEQFNALLEEKRKTGAALTEIVRRAVLEYLKERGYLFGEKELKEA